MIISFGWTSWAFCAFRKTVTRRAWAPKYAERFKPASIHQAWSNTPFVTGAESIGTVKVLRITSESTVDMPDRDYEAEGFAFFAERPDLAPDSFLTMFIEGGRQALYADPPQAVRAGFDRWREKGEVLYVVRFAPLSVSRTVPPPPDLSRIQGQGELF